MTELSKRLRALKIIDEVGSDNSLGRDAADVIDDLAKALELAQVAFKGLTFNRDHHPDLAAAKDAVNGVLAKVKP